MSVREVGAVSPTVVNVENFVRAETDRMFASFVAEGGGVNRFVHRRAPTRVEDQPVIRMNRDTLYSTALVDISDGALLSIPDGGDRYMSVMVVNQDHYINRVFHRPGEHALTVDEFDTQWVVAVARVLVDPADRDDVVAVNALQDRFSIEAKSERPFERPRYDTATFDATRNALLELARGLRNGFGRSFGSRDEVDPVRHLLGTAAGWGGLPDYEARYTGVEPGLPVGEYKLTVRDVPVDDFWSVSVYNADAFFEPNSREACSVNNLTAVRDTDGSVAIHFGGDDDRPQSPSDHGRLELHRAAVPSPPRGARRLVELPRDRATVEKALHAAPAEARESFAHARAGQDADVWLVTAASSRTSAA
jgi:hypothetical protein